jgi:hypothetical protein
VQPGKKESNIERSSTEASWDNGIPHTEIAAHCSKNAYLETDRGQRVHALLLGRHVRQAVALLDLLLDRAVQLVVGVVLGGEAPLVAREDLAGLEHTVDLGVHTLADRRVAGGLNGVHTVKGVVREGRQLHEIGLHGERPALEPRGSVQVVASDHLVLSIDKQCTIHSSNKFIT